MNDRLERIGDVDAHTTAAIEQLLADGTCARAFHFASIGSTNTRALADVEGLRRKDSGQRDDGVPILYVTDEQTAGRGRRGRTWNSDDGALTFSMTAAVPHGASARKLMSLAVGVGVARALESEFTPLVTRLKWPNDVWAGGGKVVGILLESTQSVPDLVVIGIGINVSRTPEITDSRAPSLPTNLVRASGRSIQRHQCLEPCVRHVIESLTELETDPGSVLSDFRGRCMLTDQQVQYEQGSQQYSGMCLGISDEGALRVDAGDGPTELHSGEASLLRVMN